MVGPQALLQKREAAAGGRRLMGYSWRISALASSMEANGLP
jgi:hypothetical protein